MDSQHMQQDQALSTMINSHSSLDLAAAQSIYLIHNELFSQSLPASCSWRFSAVAVKLAMDFQAPRQSSLADEDGNSPKS